MSGKFIVFEGIDCCGKTTQITLLYNRLSANGITCNIEVEPTRSPVGKVIRQEYLSGNHTMIPRCLNMLFTVDRYDHITNEDHGLRSKLERGINILQDRYYLSGVAYYSCSVPTHQSLRMQRENIDLLRPTLTVFIDIDPAVSIERLKNGRDHREIYETYEKQKQVRYAYWDTLKLFEAEGDEFFIVNGEGGIYDVHEQIWNRVYPILKGDT